MGEFDPRVTPLRGDIAAASLKGKVAAKTFREGTAYQVTSSVLPIRKVPTDDGPQETQALFGETITIYDEQDSWGWGQAHTDNYVGYVDMAGLAGPPLETTHAVSALRTYRYSEPDLKSAPYGLISLNAQVAASDEQGEFVQDHRGGWIFKSHLVPLREREAPMLMTAMGYLHTPYFWGGRESLGLDCSALVQNAFAAAGVALPRDTDMQEAYLAEPTHGTVLYADEGRHMPAAEILSSGVMLQPGDLLFWPGHVAIACDADTMIHANATHMAVTIDPIVALCTQWEKDKNLFVSSLIRPVSAAP